VALDFPRWGFGQPSRQGLSVRAAAATQSAAFHTAHLSVPALGSRSVMFPGSVSMVRGVAAVSLSLRRAQRAQKLITAAAVRARCRCS